MWKRVMAATVMTLVMASSAAAQTDRPLSVSFSAGTAPSVSGIYHEGGSGTVLNLPTDVQERDYSDIYNGGFAMKLGLGYAFSPKAELIGSFTYARADAEELSVGNVAGLDLRSQFSEYRDWGLEGGIRWHFAPEAAVNPYIAAVVGARWIDAMPATFTVPAAGVVLSDVPFYDDSVAPTFGGDFGLQFKLAPAVRLGVEAGLRWTGNLADLDGLAGTGLENLNDSSSRWTLPIMGTITFKF
jgi:opacity protein-like surface antigen